MPTIGLLEAHTIQTVSVAKSIKNLGHKVLLFCETKESYGYHTKYADEKVLTPSFQYNEPGFHKYLFEYLKKNKIDALIPMFDYSASYLSLHKEELLKFTKFIIPDFDTYIQGYDKNRFMLFCKKFNFPHPHTYEIAGSELINDVRNVHFPALIKPNITNGARGFKLVYSFNELKEELPKIVNKYGECHLQEFIPSGGKQFLVGIYSKDGEVINSTVIEKVRYYPVKGGSSCFNVSVDREDLIKLCSDVQIKLNWEGYAHYDLIEDPRNGKIKLMELNPRVQGCIESSMTSGVDFAANIVHDTLGLPLKKYKFKPGKYLRYFGLDLLWLLKTKNPFLTNPHWFRGFLSSKHYLQDGGVDDIKPLLFGTLSSIKKQLNPKFRTAKKGMN